MGLTLTAILLGFSVLVAGGSLLLHNRPYVPGRIWQPPYVLIAITATIAAVVFAAHLVSLLTGMPLEGRLSR